MLQADPTSIDGLALHARAPEDHTPFARIRSIGRWGKRSFPLALLAALLMHAVPPLERAFGLYELGDFAREVRASILERIRSTQEVSVEPEPEPEPEPVPEPEPEPVPEPEPIKVPPKEPEPTPPPPEAPAPAAAQAASVLTAQPDPNEPIDLTGNTFVQGNADRYAGGITAAKGTATTAVRNPAARPEGVVGGTGTAASGRIDRSRPAATAQTSWDCPFPAEADVEQINFQRVQVVVTVSASGKASDVKVLEDPGFGFGREARRCALRRSYVPALDSDGNPVTMTIPIIVKFERR